MKLTTTQASVIIASVTAILATVVSVVVQIAVCKSAGGEGQVYEEVGEDEGGVAVLGGKRVSGPTYMEVVEYGGKTFRKMKPVVQDKVKVAIIFVLGVKKLQLTF